MNSGVQWLLRKKLFAQNLLHKIELYVVQTRYTLQDSLPSAVPRVNRLAEYIHVYTPPIDGISNTYNVFVHEG